MIRIRLPLPAALPLFEPWPPMREPAEERDASAVPDRAGLPLRPPT